jgi:hypothetical protein
MQNLPALASDGLWEVQFNTTSLRPPRTRTGCWLQYGKGEGAMITIYRIGLATAAILCTSLVTGRSTGAPSADGTAPKVSIGAAEHSPSTAQQPSLELQSLTRVIAGRWSTEIRYGLNDAISHDPVSHGEQVWRSGPGGFTLLEEERISTLSGEQFLLAVHWWDKSAKRFKGLLCNNSGPGACNIDTYFNSSLAWDGIKLVIDLDFPKDDKKMRWHEVFSDFTANSFTQTGDMGEVGEPLKRVLTIHATRIVSAQ